LIVNRGPLIFLGTFLTIATSWFGLVFTPFVQLGNLDSAREKPTDTGYPEELVGEAARGRKVYQAMGCIYCHSQQVRPNTPIDEKDPNSEPFFADIPRGWGARRSVPVDYIHDRPVLLGTMRTGPDLANIGKRWDTVKQHKHLYNPRFELVDSIMPSFRFLYEWKDEEDVPANDPLQKELEKKLENQWEWPTKAGKKLVPSEDAKALVAYLLSLKRDGDLPKPKK
jgi:cytochrome c oxidase cbb3-type subunit 2